MTEPIWCRPSGQPGADRVMGGQTQRRWNNMPAYPPQVRPEDPRARGVACQTLTSGAGPGRPLRGGLDGYASSAWFGRGACTTPERTLTPSSVGDSTLLRCPRSNAS